MSLKRISKNLQSTMNVDRDLLALNNSNVGARAGIVGSYTPRDPGYGTYSFAWNPYGNTFYVVGGRQDIDEYTVAKPWDITTASLVTQHTSIRLLLGYYQTRDVVLSNNQQYLYLLSRFNTIYQLELATPGNMATLNPTPIFSTTIDRLGAKIIGETQGLDISKDGNYLYFTDDYGTLYKIKLRTPYMLSTAVGPDLYLSGDLKSATFKNDGSKVYVLNSTDKNLYQYNLDIPWNLSSVNANTSASAVSPLSYNTFSFSTYYAAETYPTSVHFKSDGNSFFMLGQTKDFVKEFPLSIPWELHSYRAPEIRVFTSRTQISGLALDSNTGANVYVADSADIIQYSLPTPQALLDASQTFVTASSRDNETKGLYLSDNGVFMFATGLQNGKLTRYRLADEFDISSTVFSTVESPASLVSNPQDLWIDEATGVNAYIATYSSGVHRYMMKSGQRLNPSSLSSELSNPSWNFAIGNEYYAGYFGFTFSPDGSKYYAVSQPRFADRTIYQFELEHPFIIDSSTTKSASTTTKFVYTGITPESSFTGVALSPDGGNAYIVGSTQRAIYQHTLSTPRNISTMNRTASKRYPTSGTLDSVSLSDIRFSEDGTNVYVTAFGKRSIEQFTLGTPWDISSVISNGSYGFSSGTGLLSFDITSNGTQGLASFYGSSHKTVSLSTPWQINTASEIRSHSNDGFGLYYRARLKLNNTGTIVYTATETLNGEYARLNSRFLKYPYDLTASPNDNTYFGYKASNVIGGIVGVHANSSGDLLYYLTDQGHLYQHRLNTKFDIYSNVSNNPQTYFFRGDTPSSFRFGKNGANLYVLELSNKTVYSYSLSTPWEIGTIISDSKKVHVGGPEASPESVFFRDDDGSSMYVIGSSNGRIREYSLSSWDLNTATLLRSNLPAVAESAPSSLAFKSDGTKMYMVGRSNRRIYEFDLTEAWNSATAQYKGHNSNAFLLYNANQDIESIYFTPSGNACFVLNNYQDKLVSTSLSNAWHANTISQTGRNLDKVSYGPLTGTTRSVTISPDNLKITAVTTNLWASTYTVESTSNLIGDGGWGGNQRNLRDAGMTNPLTIRFTPDERTFYILEYNGKIAQYDIYNDIKK